MTATMDEDPILDRLKGQDPDGYEVVIEDMFQLLPDVLAGYSGLSQEFVSTLAMSRYPDVRERIASRSDCSSALLEKLSFDPDASVVRQVAANANTPAPVIAELAGSRDEWVRWQVARRTDISAIDLWETLSRDDSPLVQKAVATNPSCPQAVLMSLALKGDFSVQYDMWEHPSLPDEVKATLSVAGINAPEDYQLVQAWVETKNLPSDADSLGTLASSPALDSEALRGILSQVGADINAYSVRSKLAGNPNADDALLSALVASADHRWEWRSLWARFFPKTWPSSKAFGSPELSEEARAALNRAGHPAGLLCVDLPATRSEVPGSAALGQLINSNLLVRALWRELALTETFRINAWNDNVDGDKFYLELDGKGPSEGPVAYVLGGYSEDREWAELQEYLSENDAIRALAYFWEDWEFQSVDGRQLDEAMCAALAFAVENTDHLALLDAGSKFIQQTAEGLSYIDREDVSTKVVIVESELPHIGYGDLSDEKKQLLVDLLVESRDSSLLREWGIVEHFLVCIQNHPETPVALSDRIERLRRK